MHQHFEFLVRGPLNSYKLFRDERWFALVKRIRDGATIAGVPSAIPPRYIAGLNLTFFWEKGPRFDISNIVKLFEDAIFRSDARIHQLVAQHVKREGLEFAFVEVAFAKAKEKRGSCTCNWMRTTTIIQKHSTLSV